MKTKIAILFAGLFMQWGFAQNHDDGGLKSRKGNFSTELNINPFKANLSLNNALNQMKVRYFIQDDLALRLGVGINVIDSTWSSGAPYSADSYFISTANKQSAADFTIGIEKHFPGTQRLSPYIGADLSWGVQSSNQKVTTNATTFEIDNGLLDMSFNPNLPIGRGLLIPNGYTRFGAVAIVGFDFYMAKNFFVGYEFNVGYNRLKYKTPTIESIGENGGIVDLVSNSSVTSFKTSLMNGIRIGYTF
ncbi:hypothetical protein [Sphingobacterium corticibacter]|uniref:Outer membrane protein beta-barrel domain-containing protein n=1 Tax=Sphingobacterium corticibacter TaxID=2171749 RepID=A0A2T8HLT8_9SPHI|nr:hypothetical protein [Sphingobacterium corticibacter]PVH26397.1 hypothetical protein DC487_01890 [Sphingobacterium corticibacter]